jgi:ornithine cyclodeaminase/alanine dehydrogenase-like protein (mu-crystallin family)
VPLYISEADVDALLTPGDAIAAVEASFRRLAAGEVENAPRRRLAVPGGHVATMAATDTGLRLASSKTYALVEGRITFVVCLFDLEQGGLEAVIEANRLGELRTGAASAVAASHLARSGAAGVGVIGCGTHAAGQLAAIRTALPQLERAVAWCRTPERLAAFCAANDATPAESPGEAGAQDVVVTATTSTDPVLRGDWLREGALVCAIGANEPRARELDNVVLQRATFVCCDSLEQSRLEAGDLIEPVASGVLDWLEVHELHEVVAGELRGREGERDIVVFKSNGLAAWDVAAAAVVLARARERGAGRELGA